MRHARKRAVTWSVRVLVLCAVALLVRADAPAPPPDVLGRDETRTTPQAREGTRTRRVAGALRDLRLEPGAPIEDARSHLELTLTLSGGSELAMTDQRVRPGRVPLLRTIRPADDHLLVVAVDASDEVRYSTSLPDPSVVRAEFPGSNGRLSGEEIERGKVSFVVRVPSSSEIVAVRVYRPAGDALNLVDAIEVG
jgi:hypothetical protein